MDAGCIPEIRHMLIKRKFESEDGMASAVMAAIADACSSSCGTKNAVMVTGGSFAVLMRNGCKGPACHCARDAVIILSDERHVSDSSVHSNYKALYPMLSGLGSEKSVIRPDTRLPLAESAAAYDRALKGLCESGSVLRIAFLGLGKDGHFASLFGDAPLDSSDHYAVPVKMPEPPDRISVTVEFLWSAQKIVFVVPGLDKTAAIKCVEEGRNKLMNKLLEKAGIVEMWVIE